MRLLFDIETDGLLETVSQIHSLVIKNLDTGELLSFADQADYKPISWGLSLLDQANLLAGHNIQTFDLPALKKVKGWSPPKDCQLLDSLTCSRLIWPELEAADYRFIKDHPEFPQVLMGSHSLKAWGYRLGIRKGAFSDFDDETIWEKWSKEMQEYCEQDVEVNHAIVKKIEGLNYSPEAIRLEHDFQGVIFQQEQHGIRFDERGAAGLYARLAQRRTELTDELQKVFPARVEEMKTPECWFAKADLPFGGALGSSAPTKSEALSSCWALVKERGAGVRKGSIVLTPGPLKKRVIPFNPGSRDQIAERLKELGWKPTKFTETGKPQIDETVLEDVLATLNLPPAKLLAEYLMVTKRIGQIAEGKNAWMKLVKNGRIHGRVITNGTVTGRCAHLKPNVSQVPNVNAPYGKECRDLFQCDPGYVMVGADASGLELRCLAHYMAKYDRGAYAKVLLEGDVHSENCRAMGLDPKTIYDVWGTPTKGRDIAKTFIYGYLYGAGNSKIGKIVGVKPEEITELKETQPRQWAASEKALERQAEKTGETYDDLAVALNVKGQLLRNTFETKTPALALLKAAIFLTVEQPKRFNRHRLEEAGELLQNAGHSLPSYKGFLRGLDGRVLLIRSSHAALNTLLQSAGTIAVKDATVRLYKKCLAQGWTFGQEFANLIHAHDEIDAQTRPHLGETFGKLAVESFREAGEHFKFKCPLSGEFRIGQTWADVH